MPDPPRPGEFWAGTQARGTCYGPCMRPLGTLLLLASGWMPLAAAAETDDRPRVVEVHAAGDVQLLWLSPNDHLLLGRVPYRYPGGPAIMARLDGRILYVNGQVAGADLVDLTTEEAAKVLTDYRGKLPGVAVESRTLPQLAETLGKRVVRALAVSIDQEHTDLSLLVGLRSGLQALWLKTVQCEDGRCFKDAELTAADWRPIGQLSELRYFYTDSGPAAGAPELAKLRHLEHLVLGHEVFTDAVMKQVGGLTGLRSLDLSATEVTAAGLGPLAKLRSLRRLRVANGEPNDANAKLFATLTNLEELDLAGADISDPGIALLARLPRLEVLDLSDTTLTPDGGLRVVSLIRGLRKLRLGGVELSEASFVHLSTLSHLEWLDLGQTKTTPTALRHLHGLVGLSVLHLGSGGTTDAHFAELWSLTTLKELIFVCDAPLCCGAATSAGLEGIERLTDLRILELRAAQLHDAGMLRLRELEALRKLSLIEDSCYADDFELTDAGLFQLLPLEHLWVLRLPNSEAQVSEEGLAHFRAQRPGCQISWVKHAVR